MSKWIPPKPRHGERHDHYLARMAADLAAWVNARIPSDDGK